MGLPVVLYCTLTANAFHLSPRSAAGVSCHPLIPRKDAEKEKRALIQIPRGARSRWLPGRRSSQARSLLPDRLLCVTCITFQPALGSSVRCSPLSIQHSIEPLRHIKTCRKADLSLPLSARFSVRKILIIESTRKNDGTHRLYSYCDFLPYIFVANNSLWGIYSLRGSLKSVTMRAREDFAATPKGIYTGKRRKKRWQQRFYDFYNL
jgi:hypothetical protein